MDSNREISAILTSVIIISFLIISIWLYRYFKAKKKAKAEAGVTSDRPTKK